MIPPNNEELDDTLTSDESGSDEDIYDPDMTKLQLRSIFHKKYYKKCKNDARVKMTMVNGKAWYECPENCGKARSITALDVIEHYVVHNENQKFKCVHDDCNSQGSKLRKNIGKKFINRLLKLIKYTILNTLLKPENSETSSIGKLVRHIATTRGHKDENFILLPDGNKVKKDDKGYMILAREVRKMAGVI